MDEEETICDKEACQNVKKNLANRLKNCKAKIRVLVYKLQDLERNTMRYHDQCANAVNAKETAEAELLRLQKDCEFYKNRNEELSEKAASSEIHLKNANEWRNKHDEMGGLAEKLEQTIDEVNSKYVKSVSLLDQYEKKFTSLRAKLELDKAKNDPIINRQKILNRYLNKAITLIDLLSRNMPTNNTAKATKDLINLFRRDDVRVQFNAEPYRKDAESIVLVEKEPNSRKNKDHEDLGLHLSDDEEEESIDETSETLEALLKSPEIKKREPQMKYDKTPIKDHKVWPKRIRKPNPKIADLADRGVLDARTVHSRSIPAPYAYDAINDAAKQRTKSLLHRSSGNSSEAGPSNPSGPNPEPVAAATTIHGRKGKTVREQQAENMQKMSIKEKVAKMREEQNLAGNSKKIGEIEPLRPVSLCLSESSDIPDDISMSTSERVKLRRRTCSSRKSEDPEILATPTPKQPAPIRRSTRNSEISAENENREEAGSSKIDEPEAITPQAGRARSRSVSSRKSIDKNVEEEKGRGRGRPPNRNSQIGFGHLPTPKTSAEPPTPKITGSTKKEIIQKPKQQHVPIRRSTRNSEIVAENREEPGSLDIDELLPTPKQPAPVRRSTRNSEIPAENRGSLEINEPTPIPTQKQPAPVRSSTRNSEPSPSPKAPASIRRSSRNSEIPAGLREDAESLDIDELLPTPKQSVPVRRSTRSSEAVYGSRDDAGNLEIEEPIPTPKQSAAFLPENREEAGSSKVEKKMPTHRAIPVRPKAVLPASLDCGPPTRVRGFSTMPAPKRQRKSEKSVDQPENLEKPAENREENEEEDTGNLQIDEPLPSISPPKKLLSENLELAENPDQTTFKRPSPRKQHKPKSNLSNITVQEKVKPKPVQSSKMPTENVEISENLPSTSSCSVISLSTEISFSDNFLEESEDSDRSLRVEEEIVEKSPKKMDKVAVIKKKSSKIEDLGLDVSDSEEEPESEQPQAPPTISTKKPEPKRTAILIDIPLKKPGRGIKRAAELELAENTKKLRKNQRENGKNHLRLAFDLKLPVEQLPQVLEEKGVKLENGCILMEIEEAVDVMIEYLKKSQHAEMWGLLLKQKREQKTEELLNKEEEMFLNVAATFIREDGRLLLEFAKRIIYEFAIMNSTSTCSRISASFARLFCHSIYFAEKSLETSEDLEKIAVLPQKLLSIIFLRHEQQAGRILAYLLNSKIAEKFADFLKNHLSIDYRLILWKDEQVADIVNWLIITRFSSEIPPILMVSPGEMREFLMKNERNFEGLMVKLAKTGDREVLKMVFEKMEDLMREIQNGIVGDETKKTTVLFGSTIDSKITENQANTIARKFAWITKALSIFLTNSQQSKAVLNALVKISPQIVEFKAALQILGISADKIEEKLENRKTFDVLSEIISNISSLISQFTRYPLEKGAKI
ncbi:unnamed protein product [Caenorhabditis angaria]|uniref:Uncharacterized protein n=1 Tax=Caenorhabditis angaria TaxID=860376 RepID=A0A9P1I6U7_9PELO|nr:unnamed protein product [Caenorhabditis angaria]